GVDVGNYWYLRFGKSHGVQIRGEPILRGLHERAMEGSAYRQHNRPFRTLFLRQFGRAFDGSFAPRDHDLVGRIDVRWRCRAASLLRSLATSGFERLESKRQDGRHL